MKKHIYIYGALILIFICYNLFFKLDDERTDSAINILLASIIFGYISWMAFVFIRHMKKRR